MYLLNTQTGKLSKFGDQKRRPPYAILSHRWGHEEITFQQIECGEFERDSAGYRKIKECCVMADSWGYNWVWIDTCCIDKKSSAELSEAINSMFKWYKEAKYCFVYLSDVTWNDTSGAARFDSRAEFRRSAWFSRVWTLQELLAPDYLAFFDRYWRQIGNLNNLIKDVSTTTGIKEDCLGASKHSQMGNASIATRMSWASNRQATLSEDIAYSLLGIFDVSMPILYGEGTKAFKRLQREIITRSDDESIFAWRDRPMSLGLEGMLAESPQDFARSRYIESRSFFDRKAYAMTNKGLEIELPPWFSWNEDPANAPEIGHGAVWKSKPLTCYSDFIPLNCQLVDDQGREYSISVPVSSFDKGRTWDREHELDFRLWPIRKTLDSEGSADPQSFFHPQSASRRRGDARMIYIT